MRPARIIDTHQHFWDLSANYYPWLTDRKAPKPYGSYDAICRNYLPPDFVADIGTLPIVKSVHVNAGHDRSDPVRETRWLQALADDPTGPGFPHGIVADADLSAPDVGRVLHAHAAFPRLRGVRTLLSDTIRQPDQHPDLLAMAQWQDNVALLAPLGLSLDLQLYPQQMPAVAALAARNPALQIILCHTGSPEDHSPAGLDLWRDGLRAVAQHPNVALKISGLDMGGPMSPAELRAIVHDAVGIFGVSRCMFASNFPVDRLFTSYAALWEGFIAATADFADVDIDALFYGNAVRLYRL